MALHFFFPDFHDFSATKGSETIGVAHVIFCAFDYNYFSVWYKLFFENVATTGVSLPDGSIFNFCNNRLRLWVSLAQTTGMQRLLT